MTASSIFDAELPLFPLQTVLFPDGLLELKVFEARYLDLMSSCLRESKPFGVVGLKSGAEARVSGDPVALYEAGTLAELIEVDSAQAGILLVRCRGGQRFSLTSARQQTNGLWLATTSGVADDPLVGPSSTHANIVRSLEDAIAALAAQDAKPFLEPHRFDSAGWVANRWCEILPWPIEAKQRLLMLDDPLARLEIVDSLMRSKQSGGH